MKDLEDKISLLDTLQSSCVGCGLCLEACATFQQSGWEHESPRGRLHLAAKFLHGQIPLNSSALETFDRCLGCQACEPLCPRQVPYRQIRSLVQELRTELKLVKEAKISRSCYREWIKLASRVGSLWWRHYGWRLLALRFPTDQKRQGSFLKTVHPSNKDNPTLVVGCVQDLLEHHLIEQTLLFMQRLGHPIALDPAQPCCGAIFERLIHGGQETIVYAKDRQKAVEKQQQTAVRFSEWLPERAYFLSKGCQCFAEKQMRAGLGDLYEWIFYLLKEKQITLSFAAPLEVYYQPYCNQGKQDFALLLLKQIQGLTIKEMSDPLTCCGGYCGEFLLHPESAKVLGQHKLVSIPQEATIVVTSSDCMGQFKTYQAEKQLTLLYPIELLAQSVFSVD